MVFETPQLNKEVNLNLLGLLARMRRPRGKELLEWQTWVYAEWGIRSGVLSHSALPWFDLFVTYTARTDVLDVTDADEDAFVDYIYSKNYTSYFVNEARKAIRQLRKYYMARSKNGRERLKAGRPPHMDKVEAVMELRSLKTPLPFRAISRAIGVDVHQIYKWYKRGLAQKLENKSRG
jgi:hypothetical protein